MSSTPQEVLANQIEYSNYLQKRNTLAFMQLGKFEVMLKCAILHLPEEQKEEYVNFIAEMEGERMNLGQKFRDIINNK